jgi:hypothetical protein
MSQPSEAYTSQRASCKDHPLVAQIQGAHYCAVVAGPGWHRIDISSALGLYVLCTVGMSADMQFELWVDNFVYSGQIWSGSVSETEPVAWISVPLGLVAASLKLIVLPTLGEVTLDGKIEVVGLAPVTFSHMNLLMFDPSVGVVDSKLVAEPPVMSEQPWGRSGPSSPGILRLHVSDESRVGTDIGSRVKQLIFPEPEFPAFFFNVVPCCASPDPNTGKGAYADPTSIWFNVFYGIYEIDCHRSAGWNRPFGYQNAADVSSKFQYSDLERIGKADWNWFSNYLYGVPEEVCAQHSDIGQARFEDVSTVTIGSTQWHRISMRNVTVASAYQSPGGGQLQENCMMTDEWRRCFGQPWPREGFDVSFIPTTLRSTLFMSYTEHSGIPDPYFSTLIFGGTCRDDGDAGDDGSEFLDAQVTAAQQTIQANYPMSGFTT